MSNRRRGNDPSPILVNKAAELAAKWAGVGTKMILSSSQMHPAVHARNAMALGMRRGGGFAVSALARALGKHEATMGYSIRQAEDLERVDRTFRKLVFDICELTQAEVAVQELIEVKVPVRKPPAKVKPDEIPADVEALKPRIIKLKRIGWSVAGIAKHFEVPPAAVAKVCGVTWSEGR
jgi:hypothetical protein